ncbi:MAG: hypothetical protein AUG49_03280 [Catenulispora sp. 13_1_20CM_3_70_7]|nr:MAG: hypothetical protein AUG49_03280 [Catenulispora sp. 13_1_20CM_3_70_7]
MIPAPFRGSWCATDLGHHRPCRYTYERYPIESLPALDEASFAGDFAWRGDLGHVLDGQVAVMDRLTTELAETGLSLPADFVTYMTRSNLYRCLDEVSCTGCWTSLSTPLTSPLEPGARMVRFFRDQQDCVLWYLYLRANGESFVVHSYRDLEYEAELRSSGTPDDLEQPAEIDDDPDCEIFWCAPTVEIFAYRFWTENSLWFAIHNSRPIEDLSAAQRAYLSGYEPARQERV